MTEIRVSNKQSLVDLCLQYYGSTEFLFSFASLNGLQVDSDVEMGDTLIYDETLGDQRIKNKILTNNLTPQNKPVEGLEPKGEGIGFWSVEGSNIVQ